MSIRTGDEYAHTVLHTAAWPDGECWVNEPDGVARGILNTSVKGKSSL